MKNGRTNVDVVRAWKDLAYRATLSSEELAAIPASPIGMSELDSKDLEAAFGGKNYKKYTRWGSGCRKSKRVGTCCVKAGGRETPFKAVFR